MKFSILFSCAMFSIAASAEARSIESFSLPQMNPAIGAEVFSTANYDDGVYVIETYQLRCSYCNTNAPNMVELAGFYGNNERVKFIDLGLDRADRDYAQWITRHNIEHYVLKDAERVVVADLGTRGTPTTYILDAGLNIVWEHEGVWSASDIETMKTIIDANLATR